MDRAWQKVDDALDRIRREVEVQREKSNHMCRLRTAHNWIEYKTKVDYDDETMTFFWRAHTLTVLVFLICCLLYVGVVEEPVEDSAYNLKRGSLAAIFFFVALGMTIMPDGPFVRPHPAIWRLAFAVSIVYELILIVLLFQTPMDARKMLKFVDPNLGEPIPEKDYGGNCLFYDESKPDDPYHNIKDKVTPCRISETSSVCRGLQEIFTLQQAIGKLRSSATCNIIHCNSTNQNEPFCDSAGAVIVSFFKYYDIVICLILSIDSLSYHEGGRLHICSLIRLLVQDAYLQRSLVLYCHLGHVRVFGVLARTSAAQLQRVLVGSLDPRRDRVQRGWHPHRALYAQVPFHQNVQLEGAVEHTHVSGQDQENHCTIHVSSRSETPGACPKGLFSLLGLTAGLSFSGTLFLPWSVGWLCVASSSSFW